MRNYAEGKGRVATRYLSKELHGQSAISYLVDHPNTSYQDLESIIKNEGGGLIKSADDVVVVISDPCPFFVGEVYMGSYAANNEAKERIKRNHEQTCDMYASEIKYVLKQIELEQEELEFLRTKQRMLWRKGHIMWSWNGNYNGA